jgi:hypothetical protein
VQVLASTSEGKSGMNEKELHDLLEPMLREVKETMRENEKREKPIVGISLYTKEETKEIGNDFREFRRVGIRAILPERVNTPRLICLVEQFSIPMVKHHVNKTDMVFMPRHIHEAIKHKRGDGKLEGVVG